MVKQKKVCSKGHVYYKSSDCPICPHCEKEGKPAAGFLSLLSAPATRALENNKLTTLKRLSGFSEKEILKYHEVGPATIPVLKKALKSVGLSFAE